jgi:hypothetical protein
MDEEELAFQKSLAKNYSEEMAELDDGERCVAPRSHRGMPHVPTLTRAPFVRNAWPARAQGASQATRELHGDDGPEPRPG